MTLYEYISDRLTIEYELTHLEAETVTLLAKHDPYCTSLIPSEDWDVKVENVSFVILLGIMINVLIVLGTYLREHRPDHFALTPKVAELLEITQAPANPNYIPEKNDTLTN